MAYMDLRQNSSHLCLLNYWSWMTVPWSDWRPSGEVGSLHHQNLHTSLFDIWLYFATHCLLKVHGLKFLHLLIPLQALPNYSVVDLLNDSWTDLCQSCLHVTSVSSKLIINLRITIACWRRGKEEKCRYYNKRWWTELLNSFVSLVMCTTWTQIGINDSGCIYLEGLLYLVSSFQLCTTSDFCHSLGLSPVASPLLIWPQLPWNMARYLSRQLYHIVCNIHPSTVCWSIKVHSTSQHAFLLYFHTTWPLRCKKLWKRSLIGELCVTFADTKCEAFSTWQHFRSHKYTLCLWQPWSVCVSSLLMPSSVYCKARQTNRLSYPLAGKAPFFLLGFCTVPCWHVHVICSTPCSPHLGLMGLSSAVKLWRPCGSPNTTNMHTSVVCYTHICWPFQTQFLYIGHMVMFYYTTQMHSVFCHHQQLAMLPLLPW